jgi:hypothetical protein
MMSNLQKINMMSPENYGRNIYYPSWDSEVLVKLTSEIPSISRHRSWALYEWPEFLFIRSLQFTIREPISNDQANFPTTMIPLFKLRYSRHVKMKHPTYIFSIANYIWYMTNLRVKFLEDNGVPIIFEMGRDYLHEEVVIDDRHYHIFKVKIPQSDMRRLYKNNPRLRNLEPLDLND